MSRRRFTSKQRIKKQLTTRIEANEIRPLRFRARLGDGTNTNTVLVPNKPNFNFARRDNRGIIEEVLNLSIVPRDNLPVIIGYRNEQPDLLQVLGVNWREVVGPSSFAYLPLHHHAHELFNALGGDDVVWVQKQQILPLLAYATSPASMQVNVFQGWYPFDDGFTYFPSGVSADLTAQIPAVAGNALFVLITIDGATNLLQITVGATFSIFLPLDDIDDLIPEPPAGSVPVVAVYLPNGTTSLTMQANLYDIRAMFQPIGGSIAPASHDLLSVSHADTDPATPTVEKRGVRWDNVNSYWEERGYVPDLAELHDHTYQEDMSAMLDGVETDFITMNEFAPETTMAWLNGILQHPVSDYVEGSFYDTVELSSAPTGGNVLIVAYTIA